MKMRGLVLVAVIGALFALGWWLLKDAKLDVLLPAGSIAEEQRSLLLIASILSAIVVIPVFTLLLFFSVWYREGNDKAVYDPNLTHNNTLETLWWGIPIFIIGILAVLTWQTSHSLDPYKAIASSNKTLYVDVVALQWKWLFMYPKQQAATVDEVVVPVKVPVEFSLTADAPMSSFWVPSLGSQIYTMNGMTSKLNLIANKPGDYMGYNTNINGEGYAKMDFVVHAVSQAEFEKWRQEVIQSPNTLDWAEYLDLRKPSTLDAPKAYTMPNSSLHHAIQMQYMSEGSH